ncbi:hypothetical protein BMS3Bbin02_00015 [bacterium BMS3Bbin02]|nr:hypothetical protein BMS3Bbin02_00015 [bacterium BMS3Bbin02]
MKRCKFVAEHVAQATEEVVFDMLMSGAVILMSGAVISDATCKRLGLGVLIGPNAFILHCKELAKRHTDCHTVSTAVPMTTRRKPDPDEPCLN